MATNETVLRFDEVSFEYGFDKPILDEASFNVRRGSKITFMGQNGAGKSTIFKLITKTYQPESGGVHVGAGLTVATAHQVMLREDRDLTIRDYFQKYYGVKAYDIDPRIDDILEVVNLKAPHDRIVKSFSGGQQARLLLAAALIQKPDILLLDEPTNNLDREGIEHLSRFIINYPKTCIVISHDADFLNSFTQGVLYLDIHTHKIEQYVGNYLDVVAEITIRIEKENRKNAQIAKGIQENKDKANFFAHKGGRMRLVAKRMREEAEELEANKVDVRLEDKTIRSFVIPSQEGLSGDIVKITSFTMIKNHKPTVKKAQIALKKNQHLQITGPNGIGKTTLLESLASGEAKGAVITEGVTVGYYRQDFSTLNFDDTVYESLASVTERHGEEQIRRVAAGFLLTGDMAHARIGTLSEGEKGLVSFARLVLQAPGLLILDEPTNHINFRHIPVIAAALDKYTGAMILVSHVPEFVKQIRIDEVFDLEK